MNWSIYDKLLKKYDTKDFRTLRIRLAFFLLTVTEAKLSEILVLKVINLRTLEEKSFIELKNKTILIQNQKIREIINQRREDINYLNKIKYNDDFIFTKDIDGKIPLRRETFTQIINRALQSIGVGLKPPRKLTSRSFQNWNKN